MNDLISRGSFIRTSRNFPTQDARQLAIEVNRSYLEIARTINNRVIGFFTINRSNLTGENWYLAENQRQQGIRQVYQWSDSLLTIPHGLSFNSLTNFVRIWGTFFDGTNWQTLPYVDVVAANNQISVLVNATNIVITKGGGSPPTCANGIVVVEFIANP